MNEEIIKLYQTINKRIDIVNNLVTYTEAEEYRKQGALSELEELKELLDTMI